jgi:hypothetical protein
MDAACLSQGNGFLTKSATLCVKVTRQLSPLHLTVCKFNTNQCLQSTIPVLIIIF